ncbi:carbamate kinase [Candidatus Falkowbacteria bacterium RIFOXYB2_FULL_34_18]|uniref:Carbamate kinase n=1 Tax=Candidatus Falkowbacteria bacterium RIFOXYD2_FULL_34_120 TaxID=1798007 RepID=A0A1F5TT11_9BACT|nr:MAG: carbamate kinase [Candidatus Falkowbacteria bacterium RIFOXYB2_FULL_34_18]OGF29688.1 MAG: carbamate kinase [Candidatus Falkowbacteria bacterium RIFOXYC12_FULL_34_55]OGF37447.1 MAG: carbamate kinase [Candidatus Falkowbacteria bacterium RIFOXYC2_FULL_34_220]OGF39172.1 MAG: carbamate kinase [Candidatus Falkowbacteria bacterium RIFOXYD12_FULL_34_57]OGF41721.1 MAG: carbamate kinase [Candidatus Falkowbacteria bacterium RIFOXYD2_FULL_34_120]
MKTAVIALGGNALLQSGEQGTIKQQEKNAYKTCADLVKLLKNKYRLVITHGNGPQVGNILLRNMAGFEKFNIPQMPLDVCVADSQGGIGYMIERQLKNILNKEKINKNIITLITQVLVNKKDPAFSSPSKPIGPFYTEENKEKLKKEFGWQFINDEKRGGWRRLVASPAPIEFLNQKIIKDLFLKGNVVIASGGGGIPIYKDKKNNLCGVEAVVDKDLASAQLASKIGAKILYIITDVPKVYINFNKPNQKELNQISLKTAQKYYKQGEFGRGSMGPKILAAINFIKSGGQEVIISDSISLDKNKGTRIVK